MFLAQEILGCHVPYLETTSSDDSLLVHAIAQHKAGPRPVERKQTRIVTHPTFTSKTTFQINQKPPTHWKLLGGGHRYW